jgi:hypothetical protein
MVNEVSWLVREAKVEKLVCVTPLSDLGFATTLPKAGRATVVTRKILIYRILFF